MRLTEANLRNYIRAVIINEVGGSDYADDFALQGLRTLATDPEARKLYVYGLDQLAGEILGFGGSLLRYVFDTWVYFKTSQAFIDAVRGITGKDITPESQREWRSKIAAGSIHEFLDRFGVAGLDIADVINGLIYMYEEEWAQAGLCMTAAIPVVGSAIGSAGKVGKAGKFALAAEDVAKMDAKIAEIKSGLKQSGHPGADQTIKEIERIRSEMNGATADFSAYENIPASRTEAVEQIASDLGKLEDAYNDVQLALKQVGDIDSQTSSVADLVSKGNLNRDPKSLGFTGGSAKARFHPDYPDIVVKTGKGDLEVRMAEKYPGIVTRGRVVTDAAGHEIAIMERVRPLNTVSHEELFAAIRKEFPEIPDEEVRNLLPSPGDEMGTEFMNYFMMPMVFRTAKTPQEILDVILRYNYGKKAWVLEDGVKEAVENLRRLKNNEKFNKIATMTRNENGYWQDMFRLDNMGLDAQGNIKILDVDVGDADIFRGQVSNPPPPKWGAPPPPIDDPAIREIVDQVMQINGIMNESVKRWSRLAGLIKG